MATVVWFVASAAAIVSALGVILQRNPFISAIALLGNLASLATLYVLLSPTSSRPPRSSSTPVP